MKNSICLTTVALLVMTAGCGKSGSGAYADKPEAQEITCINNLKQIGLGLHTWAGDHGDKNPFELSTNVGGVMELVATKYGIRQNARLIFQCASNELASPLVLVCPQDGTKHPAKDWSSLNDSNVSYVFPATNNILIVCPVDGNVLYLDGSVGERKADK